MTDAAKKFDPARAAEYQAQSRIALAGYEACHELAACVLAAALENVAQAHILVAGAGGGANEIVNAAKLEPGWRFTALDPSQSMLDLSTARLTETGLIARTEIILGTPDDLPANARFDAATLIGVLHHLPGDEVKRAILSALSSRLKPGAPLILAANHYAYASEPLLLAAWANRWRMNGATAEEVEVKLGKILQGADPPHSEDAIAKLLQASGFEPLKRFFSSLFWGAWIARRSA